MDCDTYDRILIGEKSAKIAAVHVSHFASLFVPAFGIHVFVREWVRTKVIQWQKNAIKLQ